MSNEKHYHIHLLPNDPVAWFMIALAIGLGGVCWAGVQSERAKVEIEKAKLAQHARP